MVVVKSSEIHGKGLFSTEKISKHSVLGTCEVTKTKEPNAYTLWLGKKAVDVTCDFKYINHSKKPNVVYYDDLTIVALKNIKPGEELTHKYG
jgi:SET domain-containing protein